MSEDERDPWPARDSNLSSSRPHVPHGIGQPLSRRNPLQRISVRTPVTNREFGKSVNGAGHLTSPNTSPRRLSLCLSEAPM